MLNAIKYDLTGNYATVSKFCYNYFNTDIQNRPCWDCPCLLLYRKFIKAQSETERKRLMSSVEVGLSHSPAGRMHIYRHFELGASLIPNEFLSDDHKIADRISFIRETVIDRTVEVEVLFMIIKTAAELDKFVGNLAHVAAHNPEKQKETVHRMFNHIAEGLGRSFQANHILKVNFDDSNGGGMIETEYICTAASLNDAGRKELAEKERQVMEDSRKEISSMKLSAIHEYFQERDTLFKSNQTLNNKKLSFIASELIQKYMDKKNTPFGISEILKKDEPEFFEKSFSNDCRCLIIPVPPTNCVLLVLTSDPENWERSSPEGELLPRYPEMELCHCVTEMLGHLLQALEAAKGYAALLIEQKLRQLMHEMGKVLSSIPLNVDQIHKVVQTGVRTIVPMSELIKQYNLIDMTKQWHKLLEYHYKRPRTLQAEKIYELAKHYIIMTCNNPETMDGIEYDLFEEIAESGIPPNKLRGIEDLRKMPPTERCKLLAFVGNLISTYTAIAHIRDSDVFMKNIYNSILAKSHTAELDIPTSIEQVIRIIGLRLPTDFITIRIINVSKIKIDNPAFFMIIKNLLSNAIEATLREDCEKREVEIVCYTEGVFLVCEVCNPPPLICSQINELFKYGTSTKEGEGHGIGLFSAQEAAKRLGTEIKYSVKDGNNCFTVTFPISTKEK